MSGENDGLDIEVEIKPEDIRAPIEDLPKIDEPIIVKADEKKDPPKEISAEEGFKDLKSQLAFEKGRAEAAEARAQRAEYDNFEHQKALRESNVTVVAGAVETLKKQSTLLRQELRAAKESGDLDTEIDIVERMTSNTAKLQQLENARDRLQEAPQVQRREAAPTSKLEARVAELTPDAAKWLRQHPEVGTDDRLWQKAGAAHQLAMADGLKIDTPEYFEIIERHTGVKKDEPEVKEDPKPVRQIQPSSAPVTRNAQGSAPTGNQTIRLSREEHQLALDIGMDPKEYAKNKYLLKTEGKIS